MRSFLTLTVILLTLLVSACGKSSTAPSPTHFTLSGTVRDNAGPPLAGVHVVLEGAVARAVDTNEQGHYEFSNLPAGTFEMQFSKNGYNSARRTVSLTSDVVLDIALDAPLPPRYTLSGTVRTPWNEPLGDVGVEAVADGQVRGGSTTTPGGAYEMPGLAPIDYLVRVTKWGYSAPDARVSLTSDTRLDFVMDRGKWTLRGTVEESPPCVAQPVRGATLRVLDGPDAGLSATTASSGEYRFDALRWGTIALQISKPDYLTTQTSVDLPSPGSNVGTAPALFTAYLRLTPTSGTCGSTP